MNDHPKPPKSSDHWSLNHFPHSGAPDLETIQTKHVRRRRAQTRAASTAAAIIVLMGFGVAFLHRSNEREVSPVGPIDVAQATLPLATNSESITQDMPNLDAGFTLYADVQLDAPVFQYDDHRDAMVPIGWIRSTDTIPVDLNGLSNDQIETLQTILHSASTNEYF